MFAVQGLNTRIVRTMLSIGVDPYAKTVDGLTALDIASKRGTKEMTDIIIQAMAKTQR